MRQVLCICELMPKYSLRTRVTVLMNGREFKSTTNTGKLATRMLSNSEVRVREPGVPFDASGLVAEGMQSLILFPRAGALELAPWRIADYRKPIHLIVPDGNWRSARKLPTRVPELEGVPYVTLPPGPPSSYKLRNSEHEENLSTYEAIARALAIIEGGEGEQGPELQRRFEAIFEIMVERVLWSRGQLRRHELKHPLPEAALR